MRTHAIRHIGFHAAAALMTLLAVACVAAAVAVAMVVDGVLALPAAVAAAGATFQALRVPVGRAASWLIDRAGQ
jgi:hypothetical protein